MSDVVTSSTADLVRRGQTGDKGAFGQLVERFQEEAYGLAYYHLGHREDALDVAQQAFLAAYLHLDSLTDPARFGGWLARIVANECLRWHRRRRPALSLDAPALGNLQDGQAVSPERAAEHGELHRDLNRALMALPRPQRLALTLYYMAGLRYRKIAEVVELPVTTVKGRIQEGRKRLRSILGPTYERRLAHPRPTAVKQQSRAAVKEKIMAQLEELAIRYTSAGERAGIVLLKAKRSERYVAINLSGNQVSAILPRSARPGPPGTGMGIQTHAPDAHVSDLRPADDYRFFADVLSSAAVTVTSVDLNVATGSHEPQATVRIRRETKESAVPAPASQALALAAATDAPIRAPAAVLAVGGLATGRHTPPEPAEVVRAVEAAEASHRLSQALTTALEGRSGPVTLRLIPEADQVRIVDAERGVLDTIPGLTLNLIHHFAEAAETNRPQAGHIALSGVGEFALAMHPSVTETRLELTPLPAN